MREREGEIGEKTQRERDKIQEREREKRVIGRRERERKGKETEREVKRVIC